MFRLLHIQIFKYLGQFVLILKASLSTQLNKCAWIAQFLF